MKKKTKLLITAIISLWIFTILPISVFANSNTDTYAEENESYTKEEYKEDTAEEETGIFEELYQTVIDNSDKILSALSFIGTILVALSYKSGLLPVMEKALGSLSDGLSKIEEEFKLGESALEESFGKVIGEAKTETSALQAAVADIRASLAENEELKKNTEDLKSILFSELEILQEIFMSSSLSQYQKDRIGESFSKMKERLDGGKCENEKQN